MKRLFACLLATGFVLSGTVSFSFAASSAPPPLIADERPTAPIDRALDIPALRSGIVGVLVQSLDTGKVLYERNADTALMPASNQKILTSTTALNVLGKDFRFTTRLSYTGSIGKNGVLDGDLVLTGSGDPSFAFADLKSMAQAARMAGIRSIHGAIIADASVFDDRTLGEGWQWDDEPYYYQPQVSGLNCDENVVLVAVTPGTQPGLPVIVTPDGGERYLRVENRAVTGAPKLPSSITVSRLRGQNITTVTGLLASDSTAVHEAITVENPPLFAAERLREALEGEKISVSKPSLVGPTPGGVSLLQEHQSEPLSVLLKHFLKTSDNLYGEILLKAVGAKVSQGVGTTAGGEKGVRALLSEAGAPVDGLYIADGSGLSRMDTVTPRILVNLLAWADQHFAPDIKAIFRDALPVGGVDGTLRNRFKDTPLRGNLRAKTGTLTRVSCLSGYLTTKAGESLVFSILMNHYAPNGGASAARDAQDAVALALYNLPRSSP